MVNLLVHIFVLAKLHHGPKVDNEVACIKTVRRRNVAYQIWPLDLLSN